MAVWSITFFIKSVYGNYSLNKAIALATIGGFFGALTFACRPPIGLVNILAIPLLITFFKKYKFTKESVMKVLIVAIPYIIIGSLLMIYNYVRFENVFEFGQSYQLTISDQHTYLNLLSRFDIKAIWSEIQFNFFKLEKYSKCFPYISVGGAFINFPILMFPYILFFFKKYRVSLVKKEINSFYIVLMILPFLVTIFDVIGSPFPFDRYRMDIYYLLAILTFIGISNYNNLNIEEKKKKIYNWIILIILIITTIKLILILFVPWDSNYTDYYKNVNPSIDNKIKSIIKN